MTIVSGTDAKTFTMANRVRNFTVVNPDLIAPFISKAYVSSVTETQVFMVVQASEAFTLYFAVGPPFMREITFSQIKAKTVPYDYFHHKFFMGEHVEDSSTYEYQIAVEGLDPAQSYLFTGYVEDFSGNLAAEAIRLPFNTTGYTPPFTETLDVGGAANVTAPTNTSL